MSRNLGFFQKSSSIKSSVFIPKYYDPTIEDRLEQLGQKYDLYILGDLIKNKQIDVSTGDEIGKMAYGTGNIPFIRTTDISNWEIKADSKQGVSKEIFDKYSRKQDVEPGDIFFVRDGSYLIGSSCMITKADNPLLYQSHILKFRVQPNSPISGPLLLAILSSPIVKRQIRSKQFTADIIDTIGNRYTELVLPTPKNQNVKETIEKTVQSIIENRINLRDKLKNLPLYAQGITTDLTENVAGNKRLLENSGNSGFLIKHSMIKSNILIPKYYDPTIEDEIAKLELTHNMVKIGDLVKKGIISIGTGIEVGKMAYETGNIPFIRTSDISNWELIIDPKQSVSEDLYDKNKAKQDIKKDDILLVRDGTYLVGTSCILTRKDIKIMYCGGIYKIRVKKPDALHPYLLITLLNCPIVKKQIHAKRFTRDVIDTIGRRILEVKLPIPRDPEKQKEITDITYDTIQNRMELRDNIKQIVLAIDGYESLEEASYN